MGDRAVAETILRATAGERVRRGFPLAPMTSFRLGGPAALFLEARSLDDLAAVGEAVDRSGVPMLVLGKGSNLLIADEGFPGIVVRLGKTFRWTAREGSTLSAGGSMPLPALAGVALSHGLSGLEFGVAIPASLGGSVRMNAGAHEHALDEVVASIEIYDTRARAVRVVPAADAGFRYRGSSLPEDAIVIGAAMDLEPAPEAAIRGRMDEARAWRRATQPLAEPNCGSVFKNPEGDHAARLIESIGGKDLAVGGASVSGVHANFIIAGPGSTARDVRELIALVREKVRDAHGVELETEVHAVGWDLEVPDGTR